MCGIVGIAGDLTLKDVETFEDMLDVVQLRGRHSTGAVKVHRHNNNYDWAKRVGPPAYLKDSIEYDNKIKKGTIPKVLIGHGRHKTVGDIDVKSAHPFDFPDRKLIGVHNGTLKNYWRFEEHDNGNVDSYTLYKRLANIGAEALFEDLDGAWACVWWDGETEELCFIRNKERPMTIAYSADRRKMYWASEAWMLGAVYRRHELWEGKDGKSSPYINLETDIVYRVQITPNTVKNKPVFKITEGKKIEKKPRPNVRPHCSNTGSASGSANTTKKGGEVANPFQNGLDIDDPLPACLTQGVSRTLSKPVPKLLTTTKNSNSSTTQSKDSPALLTPPTNTSHGGKSTNSPTSQASSQCQKIKKRKLSVVQEPRQESGFATAQPDEGKIYQANAGVDTRYIPAVDTEYITDLRTGREVDERTFRKNTGGCCFHCGTKIKSLIEVNQIYDKGKRFICNECVKPPLVVSVPSINKGSKNG